MASITIVKTPSKTKASSLQIAMTVHNIPTTLEEKELDITKHDVPGIEGAFILKNVLTPEECKQYIEATEAIGYTEAPVSIGLNSAVMAPDIRDNLRVMATANNTELEILNSRIAPFVQQEFEAKGKRWKHITGPAGLNERLRFYKYEKGQQFQPHFDGCFARSKSEQSFFTFIIYLSGGLKGGETAFFPPKGPEVLVNPEVGQALVFWHQGKFSPYHAGLPHGSKGAYKYVLRSDIMYSASP